MNKSRTTQDVFQTDFNRALSARFAPGKKRQGLLQLCALDAELAKIRYQTSEPLLQRIRTQFWREALFEHEGSGHRLASDIIATFKANRPLFESLEDLIVIHEKYLDMEVSPAILWEGYCERQAVLFKLASGYLVGGNDQLETSLFHQCGMAYGGALWLCVNGHQVDENSEDIRDYYQQAICAYAEVKTDLLALAPGLRAAVLPLALVPPYLDLYQSSDKGQSQSIDLHPARKAWILWQVARKGFR